MASMRRIIITSVALLALAGCGSSAKAEPSSTLTGTFTLSDKSGIANPSTLNGGCFGKGGYDDVRSGLQVVVTDGDGKTLATGELQPGTYVQDKTYPILGDCVFPIAMDGALPKADFYKVAVGHRGELTYSYDEMVAQGWKVAFTLG